MNLNLTFLFLQRSMWDILGFISSDFWSRHCQDLIASIIPASSPRPCNYSVFQNFAVMGFYYILLIALLPESKFLNIIVGYFGGTKINIEHRFQLELSYLQLLVETRSASPLILFLQVFNLSFYLSKIAIRLIFFYVSQQQYLGSQYMV